MARFDWQLQGGDIWTTDVADGSILSATHTVTSSRFAFSAAYSTVTLLARLRGLWLPHGAARLHIGCADVSLRRKPSNLRPHSGRSLRDAKREPVYSTVTLFARFLGLWLRPALRAFTSAAPM